MEDLSRKVEAAKQYSKLPVPAEREPYDFHIRLEQDAYVIDVFDSSIDNADEAYVTTHSCDTWEQVVRYCNEYDGVTVI